MACLLKQIAAEPLKNSVGKTADRIQVGDSNKFAVEAKLLKRAAFDTELTGLDKHNYRVLKIGL